MGLEGFTGTSRSCTTSRRPAGSRSSASSSVKREEWVPDAHAHRHFKTIGIDPEGDEISGRKLLMWNNDVEISFRAPSRWTTSSRTARATRSTSSTRGRDAARDLRRSAVQGGDFVVIPRGTTYNLRAVRPTALPALRDAGLIEIPKRYRNQYGQLMEHAPSTTATSTRRPSPDVPRARRVPPEDPRARRLSGLRDRLPPVRRRGLGRLPLPVDVQHQRLRADHGRIHMPPPSHQTFSGPFVILVLSAKAGLRPDGDPDPVPPLEPPERGDDLLRRRQLLVAQGDRGRFGHAPPVGNPARAAPDSRRSRSGWQRRTSSPSCATPSTRSS